MNKLNIILLFTTNAIAYNVREQPLHLNTKQFANPILEYNVIMNEQFKHHSPLHNQHHSLQCRGTTFTSKH